MSCGTTGVLAHFRCSWKGGRLTHYGAYEMDQAVQHLNQCTLSAGLQGIKRGRRGLILQTGALAHMSIGERRVLGSLVMIRGGAEVSSGEGIALV